MHLCYQKCRAYNRDREQKAVGPKKQIRHLPRRVHATQVLIGRKCDGSDGCRGVHAAVLAGQGYYGQDSRIKSPRVLFERAAVLQKLRADDRWATQGQLPRRCRMPSNQYQHSQRC
jgi:hypothetical protein